MHEIMFNQERVRKKVFSLQKNSPVKRIFWKIVS